MNSETKRKFCGLIMFDVPMISMKSKNNNDDLANNNNNNNNNTRDINSSSYNINGPLINHHNPIFIQHNDNINSDFSTTSQALAAGAAASENDFNNNGNNNNDDTDHCDNNSGKMTQQKRTPRPPNAFILYRRAKQPAIIAAQRHLTNAEVSRQISDMWKNETEEVRLNWERYADRKKLEHMQIYPNYVYRPNKNKSKVDKRRQRRQTSMSSAKESANTESSSLVNNSNDNNNKSNVDNSNSNSGSTGPVRRKSKNNKAPIKVEINSQTQMAYDIINGYNMQSRQLSDSSNNNYASSTPTPTTATPTTTAAILPSPLLASQYTDVHNHNHHHQQQQEFVPSQNATTHTTPLTPITPPRQQAVICDNEFKFRQQPQQLQQQHDRQYQNNMLTYVSSNEGGINHPLSIPITFASNPSFNGLTAFHQAPEEYHTHQSIDPLLCFVPDVAQQQQQMLAEMMLHEQHPHQHQHHQHQHHHNPDSSSTDIQYYDTPTNAVDATVNGVLGNHHHSFTDMLAGLEFQNHYLASGSVNHGNNGLATTINANQQQYLH